MKQGKINFKHPKYYLPLVAIGVFAIMYGLLSMPSKQDRELSDQQKLDSLRNAGMLSNTLPSTSSTVANAQLNDKFQAASQMYKENRELSAINGLEPIKVDQNATDFNGNVYTPEERNRIIAEKMIDSINHVQQLLNADNSGASMSARSMGASGSVLQKAREMDYSGYSGSEGMPTPDQILNRVRAQQASQSYNEEEQPHNEFEDRMKLFKEQMKYIDSIQNGGTKSTDEAGQESPKSKGKVVPKKQEYYHVQLAERTKNVFKTITNKKDMGGIPAVIQTEGKAGAAAKVRIKILKDIYVGNTLIPKNTFVYGIVTGFQTTRVNITVGNIISGGNPLPVNLTVYDNDGYLGLYIPNSNFREFTKAIGTNATQGLSSVDMSEDGSNGQITSLISRIFSTTGQTISQLISKNKAYLKYNYIIYLKENENSEGGALNRGKNEKGQDSHAATITE